MCPILQGKLLKNNKKKKYKTEAQTGHSMIQGQGSLHTDSFDFKTV